MKYALKLVSEIGCSGSKLIHTPLEQNTKFTTREYDKKFKSNTQDKTLKDPTGYRKLIGKLLY